MKVLVVDDEIVARKAVFRSLNEEFQVTMAEDGPSAISAVKQEKPDLILLDVEMPEMNGFDVCKAIKKLNSGCEDIPVVFISSRSSVAERLRGLELGAEDYLIKPFEPEFLRAKLSKVLDYRHERDQLRNQLHEANQAAFQALSGTSEFGTAIRFVEKTHSIGCHDLLATQFFKATDQFGLNCSLMIKSDLEVKFYTSNPQNPVVSPLEKELITVLSEAKRFNDFGARTQINYPYVSLLVKNMPVSEPDRYGRYKDLLPFMIEVANATIRSLNIESQLIEQSHNLSKSFEIVKQTLVQLTDALRVNQEDVASIMNKMLMELDEEIPRMGLDDDQETYLIRRIDGAVTEANGVLDTGTNLKGSINNVIRLLDHLVDQQNQMVDKAIASKNQADNTNSGKPTADASLESVAQGGNEVANEEGSCQDEYLGEDIELF
ncbi:response regulator transcription factor [Litoribrevibacter albus]|uniref:Response regulatory domain-containing protein n=1 Tax=Litoribrevibacter albus TaxID=1473156 RepID=A0AA37WA55_9GAMM|nr:response regulator [Litoribrevibacter albus]GLQ33191.1 hypothetical protein GCM10007876_36710 [Litoribrevibacter albus]